MPQTINIPLALRQVGSETYGPGTLAVGDFELEVNLDRTPNQGLNARTTATLVTVAFDMLLPSDPTWRQVGGTTFQGGTRTDPETGQTITSEYMGVALWKPNLAGRQIRLRLTIAGPSSVRLAGSLIVR